MKNVLKWETANKMAAIFGIIGGIYLLYQLYSTLVSDKLKFESEISINEFNYPRERNKYSYRLEAESLIPETLSRYRLSSIIIDSLTQKIDLSKYWRSDIIELIEISIPSEINRDSLINRIDNLILFETYPMRNTRSYVESYVRNKSSDIIKELRLEIPSEGYFELYSNDNFIKKGVFNNNIYIGELRPENNSILKIWAFNGISELDLEYSKRLKYTFQGGYLVPTYLKSIEAKGIMFWIYENPVWAIYFFILMPLYFISLYSKNRKKK